MERYDKEDVFWKHYVEIEQINVSTYKMDIVVRNFFHNLFEYKPSD